MKKANRFDRFATRVEYGKGIGGKLDPESPAASKIRGLRREMEASTRTVVIVFFYYLVCAFIALLLVSFLVNAVLAADNCTKESQASCSELSSLGYVSLFMVGLWMAFPLFLHLIQLATRKGTLEWKAVKQVILIDAMYCYIFATVVVSVMGGMWDGLDALGFGSMASAYVFAGPLLILTFGERAMLPPGMPTEDYKAKQAELGAAYQARRKEVYVLQTPGTWKKRWRTACLFLGISIVGVVILQFALTVCLTTYFAEADLRWPQLVFALVLAPGLSFWLIRVGAIKKLLGLSKEENQEQGELGDISGVSAAESEPDLNSGIGQS